MSGNPSLCNVRYIKKYTLQEVTEGEVPGKRGGGVGFYTMALDFVAGCLGGCAGVVVGHPFDTIKVHLQTQDPKNPKYRGIWHCFKSIIAKDNIRGLYRGMSSPMLGIGGVNAIVFGIYGNVQRYSPNPESLYTHFLAGSLAGLCQSVVCSPMELAKTRMQLQLESRTGVYHTGSFDAMRYIMRTEGWRGTFRGLGSTALRDIPGFASYFVSYEYMIRLSESPSNIHILLAGGFAGIMSWLMCYPMDVIKTGLQADSLNAKPKYTGFIDCARKGYKADGINFFCRGLVSTLLRAFPSNAACFFVVSFILKYANFSSAVSSAEPIVVVEVEKVGQCSVHKGGGSL